MNPLPELIRALPAAALLALAPAVQALDWYGQFHAGTTRVDIADPAYAGEVRVEGAYGVGAGFELNRWFSAQLDWHTLGENRDVSSLPPCLPGPCVAVTINPYPEHGWALRALPRLPLGDSFAVELGLGFAHWEGDYTLTGTRFASSGTDSLYSLGVEWRIGDRWAATIEVQELAVDGVDFGWSGATLRYRF